MPSTRKLQHSLASLSSSSLSDSILCRNPFRSPASAAAGRQRRLRRRQRYGMAFSRLTLHEYLHDQSGCKDSKAHMESLRNQIINKYDDACTALPHAKSCCFGTSTSFFSTEAEGADAKCSSRKAGQLTTPSCSTRCSMVSPNFKYTSMLLPAFNHASQDAVSTIWNTKEVTMSANVANVHNATMSFDGCGFWCSSRAQQQKIKCNKNKIQQRGKKKIRNDNAFRGNHSIAGSKTFPCGFPVSKKSLRRHCFNSKAAFVYQKAAPGSATTTTGRRQSELKNETNATFNEPDQIESCPLLAKHADSRAFTRQFPSYLCCTNSSITDSAGDLEILSNNMRSSRMPLQPKAKAKCKKCHNVDKDAAEFALSRSVPNPDSLHLSSKFGKRLRRRRQCRSPIPESLSEKYKPRSFQEMVGQGMVIQALTNAAIKGKIAPVYLFHGPRGCGKSSAARIFSTSMNCSSLRDVADPCGFCLHCGSLALGKGYDIKEVDASELTGNNVNVIQSLLRFVSKHPRYGRYKVLIMEECHMLSRNACNLFLNYILEEPPGHVVFILITTDIDQLPQAILSRCQKFQFHKMKDADVFMKLQRIVAAENINIDKDAIRMISSVTNGSLSEAESILEHLSQMGQKITINMVRDTVGLVPEEKLVELLEVALFADNVNTIRCINQLVEGGIEPLKLMSQLANHITNLLAGNLNNTNKSNHFHVHQYNKQELEKLRQALRILSEAEKQLRVCDDRRTWLTATLLQLASSQYVSNHGSPHELILSSSLMGTSVTLSPMDILDTSDKETLDISCTNDPNNGTYVKPPWDNIKSSQTEEKHGSSLKDEISLFDLNEPIDQSPPNMGIPIANGNPSPMHYMDKRVYNTITDDSLCEKNDHNVDKYIWEKVFKAKESSVIHDIISPGGKLVSLLLREDHAIVHLEFSSVDELAKAKRSKTRICNSFKRVLGCDVQIKLSLSSKRVKAGIQCDNLMKCERTTHSNKVDINASIHKASKDYNGSISAISYSSFLCHDNAPRNSIHCNSMNSTSNESSRKWTNSAINMADAQDEFERAFSTTIECDSKFNEGDLKSPLPLSGCFSKYNFEDGRWMNARDDNSTLDSYNDDFISRSLDFSLIVERDSVELDSTQLESPNEPNQIYGHSEMNQMHKCNFLCLRRPWKKTHKRR